METKQAGVVSREWWAEEMQTVPIERASISSAGPWRSCAYIRQQHVGRPGLKWIIGIAQLSGDATSAVYYLAPQQQIQTNLKNIDLHWQG